MGHLLVSDADAANALVISLGATLLGERRESRTYADPAGHPFCL